MNFLKEGNRYSQGRIYLFISFVCFISLNLILAWFAFRGIEITDKETLQLVSTNLKWALGTFSLYVLGGKGIGAFRDRDVGISNSYDDHNDYGHGYGHGHYKDNPFSDQSEVE